MYRHGVPQGCGIITNSVENIKIFSSEKTSRLYIFVGKYFIEPKKNLIAFTVVYCFMCVCICVHHNIFKWKGDPDKAML